MSVSISTAKPGDLVECNVKGREFVARVHGEAYREKGRGLVIDVRPLSRNISYYNVRGREVTAVYRKLGRRRS